MAEKATAYTTPYNRSTSLANFSVRLAVLCVAVALLTWFSARIPLAVAISHDYFRQVSGVFSNPLFVFFICHVILVSLMVNSGLFSGRDRSVTGSNEAEFFEAAAKSCKDEMIEPESENDVASRETAREIVYEDKQVISEENTTSTIDGGETTEKEVESDPEFGCPGAVYRRCRSESFDREPSDDGSEHLRRSESDKCMDIVAAREDEEKRRPISGDWHRHDELSDEDFNRTVEAFIAKQLKFRREEDVYDAVSPSCGGIKSYELTEAKILS